MAVNANLSNFHPTKLAQRLLQLQYPARPLIGLAATAPIGQPIAGALGSGGATVDVNAPVKPGQSAVTSYSGSYSTDSPNSTQKSININNHEYVNFVIDKADQRKSPIQLVQSYVQPYYEELLTKLRTDLLTEYDKFLAGFTDYNSGATVMDSADITEAKRILKERQFVSDGLVSVIGPNGEKDLSDLSLFHQANTGAGGAELQRNGFLDRKFGFDIFVEDQSSAQGYATDSDAQTAEAIAADEKDDIAIDDGSAALDTAPSEGEVIAFTGATGTDQFYVVDSGSTTSALELKEGARDTVTDNTVIIGVSGDSQYFFKRGAVSLVTLGMQNVTDHQPDGGMRSVFFDPVNRVNITMTVTETKSGADVLMEALYGYKNFYPEWGVRYIRGTTAKA